VFRFRVLPDFTFTATLIGPEVWTGEQAKRVSGWVDVKVCNDASGEVRDVFSLSMAGIGR
jgi:hypothetical protein